MTEPATNVTSDPWSFSNFNKYTGLVLHVTHEQQIPQALAQAVSQLRDLIPNTEFARWSGQEVIEVVLSVGDWKDPERREMTFEELVTAYRESFATLAPRKEPS